jgi:hypothetical protein
MGEQKKAVNIGGLKVYAMGGQVGNAPMIGVDTKSGEEWVRFGRNNLFPEFCCALVDNVPALSSCVETMAMFIAGNGLEFLDLKDEPIKEAYSKWEELCQDTDPEALLESTARDIAILNTMSWQGINSRLGLARLNHVDVARVRLKKKEDGEVRGYFFSSNWAKQSSANQYKAVPIPAWGQTGDTSLIYRKSYKNLRDYYGEPHWLAAMVDAEVLARIPVFNRTQLDTGFRPAVHAHLTTNRDDADTEQIDEDFEAVFTGADGKSYVLTIGAVGEDLKITKLERGDHAGELDKTRSFSNEQMYNMYGIPPILMGVDVNTGMSGKGLAITESLSLFQTTKVAPRQKHICAAAKMVLRACGIEVPVVRIKPLVPFEPSKDQVLQRQAYMRRTTVNEDRIDNGKDPLPENDPRGNMLLIEAGSTPDQTDPDA